MSCAELMLDLDGGAARQGTLPLPVELELWLWQYVDEHSKRRRTRYRLTEVDALDRYGPTAKRVENSREVRRPTGHTSDWLNPRS